MSNNLTENNYLDLYKYFDEKASKVKGAMFSTITWIIGFAAALLGFMFSKLSESYPVQAALPRSKVIVVLSIAGIILCAYAFFALRESAKHIQNNWRYADRCKKKIKALEEIVAPIKKTNNENQNSVMKIWNQLGIVVFLFACGFLAILIWALTL